MEGTAEKIVTELKERLEAACPKTTGAHVTVMYGLPTEKAASYTNRLSIFLYDVHEELSVRHGEVRQYKPGEKRFMPRFVRMNYSFLITHWSKSDENKFDGAPLKVVDAVVGCLANTREMQNIPGSFCNTLPPSEGVDSLGSLWSALDDKPRLSFGFMVTAPIQLTDRAEPEVGMVRPFE